MTRTRPHSRIHSTRLVRFLSENGMLDAVPAPEDVGQRLADWLHFRQAIALHGVLHPQSPATPAPPTRTPRLSAAALRQHVTRVRAALEQSIQQGAPAGSGLARIDMPAAVLDEPIEVKTAFEPYRRFLTAHQRQMETVVRNLRAQVRAQLNQSSPALQQLAALDAAFENTLSEREAMLLGKVSRMLEKRFVQALKQHLKNNPYDPEKPSTDKALAWLLPLRQAMRTALLAELDTRLQPTLGLLEAFHAENAQA